MVTIVRRAAGFFAAIMVLLVVTSTSAAASTSAADVARAGAARPVEAAGTFTVVVDFPSLVTRDVRGNKCEFRVDGRLTFGGTLDGVAEGTTTAIVFAPCAEATTVPPGTYKDVFRFEGSFSGTVDQVPVTGDLTYAGRTRVGGAIDAVILLRGDSAIASLRTVGTQVGVGGRYCGTAVTDK